MKLKSINLLLYFLGTCTLLFTTGCFPILNQSHRPPLNENLDCPISFEKVGLCAQLIPLESPLRVSHETSFTLIFWEKKKGTLENPSFDPNLTPSVWLWMDMATGSHGSFPVTVDSSLDEDGNVLEGVFDVDGAIFTMNKEWQIHVELNDPDGKTVDAGVKKVNVQ